MPNLVVIPRERFFRKGLEKDTLIIELIEVGEKKGLRKGLITILSFRSSLRATLPLHAHCVVIAAFLISL